MEEKDSFEKRMQRVEELITSVEAWPETSRRDAALELVQTLMDFHGAAVERMMDITAATGAPGFAIFDNFSADPLVGNLLMLYGLHPMDLRERVLQAIEKVRPSLNLHEGDVELLGVENAVVRLRLKGSCDGCPSSALTLKHTIEEAIYAAAPDVTAIEVEGVSDDKGLSNGLVQIEHPKKNVYVNCEFVAAAG